MKSAFDVIAIASYKYRGHPDLLVQYYAREPALNLQCLNSTVRLQREARGSWETRRNPQAHTVEAKGTWL